MPTIYAGKKPFAWSFSKIKNFGTCPKRYYHVDVKKDFKEDESEILRYGNLCHELLAKHIGKNEPFPDFHKPKLQPLADKILAMGGKVGVELKLAVTEDMEPCTFFDRKAWFRGVCDVLVRKGAVAYAGDWKFGKIKEDYSQLSLMAAAIFCHYPEIKKIRTEFVWVMEDAVTREDYSRDDIPSIWAGVMPQVDLLRKAHETETFPAKPSGLCRRWCPVSSCPHHGQ